MRNNNPLNIIKSEKINWQGEVKPSTDPNFAQFETLEYGLRAAFKLLRTYYNKHGCRTIRQIVSRWDRAGYGDDGVRPERETAGRAGAFHRPRMGDEVKASPPAPPQKGRGERGKK